MEARSSLKAALLDFDGTLVHLPVDWARLREEIRQLFSTYGVVRSFSPLNAGVMEALGELERRGFGPGVRAAVHRRVNRMIREAELAAAPQAQPVPGARDLIAALRGRGLVLVVQSSNSVRAIETAFERLRYPPVDAIVGRESSRFGKPHPQGVRRALRRLGVRAREAVVIGDGDYDIALGRALGALTVRVGTGSRGPRGDYDARSLREVVQLLAAEKAGRAIA